jgi:hypothetical protein
MPTINQLVRKGRQKVAAKRNAIALHSSLDSLHRKKKTPPKALRSSRCLLESDHHHAEEAELRFA